MPGQRIENVIKGILKGDAQMNALDFVTYLRANEIPLEESEQYWEVKYKDECICFILINGADEAPGPWTIWSAQVPGSWAAWGDSEYVDFPVESNVKEVAWANVNICGNCGGCDNLGGTRKTVLGRDFDSLCNSTLAFTNPDSEMVNCAKKMIDTRKSDILRNV